MADSPTTPSLGVAHELPAFQVVDGDFESSERSGTRLRASQIVFMINDLVSLLASSVLALWLRFYVLRSYHYDVTLGPHFYLASHFRVLLLYIPIVLLCCYTQRLYRGIQVRSAAREAWAVVRAVSLATVFLICFVYLAGMKEVSRFVVSAVALLTSASLAGWRYLRRRRIKARVMEGYHARNVLVVGTGLVARALNEYFTKSPHLGYLVKGFVASSPERRRRRSDLHCDELSPVLGDVDQISRIARSEFIDEIFVTTPGEREMVKAVAIEARRCGLGVHVIPDLYDGLAWGAPVEYLGQFPTMSLHRPPMPELALLFKRMADMALSAAALLITAPLFAVVAIAVKLDSPGPVFYSSARVGKKGKIFRCCKFRTMVENADQFLDSIRHLNERDGLLFKVSNDPRVTRTGRWLRKYSIDELPQLWNVLKGEMSLVGPRPPLASEVEQYDIEYLRRLDVTPGITGLWQVEARQNPSFDTYLNLDLQYVERWNLWLDLKLLLKTVFVVVAGTGR